MSISQNKKHPSISKEQKVGLKLKQWITY